MFKMRLFPMSRSGGFEQAAKQHPHLLNALGSYQGWG